MIVDEVFPAEIPDMSLFLLALWLAPVLAVAPPTLYKCCPHGYGLQDEGFVCVEYFVPQPDHSWFPQAAIAASSADLQPRTVVPEIEPGREFSFEPCPASLIELADHMIGLDSNETLHVTHEGQLNVTGDGVVVFSSDTWCVDRAVDYDGELTGTRILSCRCLRRTCVSVCCEPSELIDAEKASAQSLLEWCVPDPANSSSWGELNITQKTTDGSIDTLAFRRYNLFEYVENCHSSQQKISEKSALSKIYSPVLLEDFALRGDGLITSSKYKLGREKYCLGQTLRRGRPVTVAFFCDKSEFVVSHELALSQSILAVVGAVFSLLTLLVHAASPQLRKGVKGASLMLHCTCMLVAYLCLACRPFTWSWNTMPCVSLAAVMQFSLLAAFFWLNVRAIIIHSTFRSLGSMLGGTSRRSLLWYSLYALGVPAVIASVTWWAQVEPNRPYWVVWPNIDAATCWFGSSAGRAVYFSAPMGVLLLVNLVLFLTTARHIIGLRRGNSILKQQGGASLNSDYKRFKLYAKLFILMGLTWSSEVFSWVNYLFRFYWHTANIATVLRAVLLFVIFCCKKKVWKELLQRHPRFRKAMSICGLGGMAGATTVFYVKREEIEMTRSQHESSTTKTSNSSRLDTELHEKVITEEDLSDVNIVNNVEVEQHQDEKPNKKLSLIDTQRNSEFILSGIADLFKEYENSKFLPRRNSDYELIENPQRGQQSDGGACSEDEDFSGDDFRTEGLQDVALPRQQDAGPSKPLGRIRALCEGYNTGQMRLSYFLRNVRGSICKPLK